MSASSPIWRLRSARTLVKRVDLVRTLDATADASKDGFIFLRADRAVPYGELMDVLEILRAGGYIEDQAGGARGRSRRAGGAPAAAQRQSLERLMSDV